MVAQIAPAVRVAISEAFGLPPGAVTIGQIVTGLKQLGFDYVFGEQRTGAPRTHGADDVHVHGATQPPPVAARCRAGCRGANLTRC